ncbi:MAG: response regulator [Gammaproteobacteria bacterium]|nr:response regulator [Gammaproteobacteria bacterium]
MKDLSELSGRDDARILLIEDEPADAIVVIRSLEKLPDFNPVLVHAETLAEGITLTSNERFDVALLDLGLPDSRGIETLRTLHSRAPNLPILVLTGFDDERLRLYPMDEGAVDFLLKGKANPDDLRRAILHTIERSRMMQDTVRSRDQLRKLVKRLQSSLEDERIWVAQEIHDEIEHRLASLKIELLSAQSKLSRNEPELTPLHEHINECVQLVNESIGEIQRISYVIRPRVLDDFGLAGAVREEARLFEQRAGVKVNLDLHDGLDDIPDAIATSAFRILQELLTNVARHAHATSVDVELLQYGSELYLEVRDDGSGVSNDVLESSPALGLLGIAERVRSHHGTLKIDGESGSGTVVTVRMPIRTLQ